MLKQLIKNIVNATGFDIIRYQNRETDLSWLHSKKIATVFDVGANVGQFAEEARHELPDAQIYSFEPVKETYDVLVENFAGDKKFRAFNVGLGSKKENKEIKISAYSLSSSFLPQSKTLETVFPHTKEIGAETVSVELLDNIWREVGEPHEGVLVKMDTQGFEAEVISGGTACLSAAQAVLVETSFVEIYSGQPLFDDIYQLLKNLGFSYHGSLRAKRHPETGEVMFEDSIFMRDERP